LRYYGKVRLLCRGEVTSSGHAIDKILNKRV
jgi:hypothetical protein